MCLAAAKSWSGISSRPKTRWLASRSGSCPNGSHRVSVPCWTLVHPSSSVSNVPGAWPESTATLPGAAFSLVTRSVIASVHSICLKVPSACRAIGPAMRSGL